MRRRRMFLSLAPVLVFTLVTLSGCATAGPFHRDPSSVFTITRDRNAPNDPTKHASAPGCGAGRFDESADVSVVEFLENGLFADAHQLSSARDCIRRARKANSNGVVVMIFVHGWRHDASWDDDHFREFRMVLLGLALRESERSDRTYRRVVGIYLGWPGGHLFEFPKRYRIAEQIGLGPDLKTALEEIARETKQSSNTEPLGSPLILAGHSMGALIFQTAYSSLLMTGGLSPLDASARGKCANVYAGNQAVLFPDLVLLLNSATDSQITRKIKRQLEEKKLSKRVDCGGLRFQAPLFISASAQNDYATEWLFWAARWGRSITDGNDDELINYQVARKTPFHCPAIRGRANYGQTWHCLRRPETPDDQLARIHIDLPARKGDRSGCHIRYELLRVNPYRAPAPLWVVRVPAELIDGHNDIFNGRARLLIMALVQISGATMSIHTEYDRMFEPDIGPCELP